MISGASVEHGSERNNDAQPSWRRWRLVVIDDDPAVVRTLRLALQSAGIECAAAASAAEGETLGADPSVDLLLIELRLGDSDGLAVIERLREQGNEVPFAIITGHGTVPLAVHAVQLGALDVIEKPFHAHAVVSKVRGWLLNGRVGRTDRGGGLDVIDIAGLSAAERWAVFVLRATQAGSDPKTLKRWVPHARTNYTSLRAASKVLGIEPHDARDFMRMLRTAMFSQRESQAIEAYLEVHDLRGLRRLFERSGLGTPRPGVRMSIREFLEKQRFVAADNEGLRALTKLLRSQQLIS